MPGTSAPFTKTSADRTRADIAPRWRGHDLHQAHVGPRGPIM